MMTKRKNQHLVWWSLLVIILLIVVYLNRSYAYFFDYLKEHQIKPDLTVSTFAESSQPPHGPKFIYLAFGDSLSAGVGVEDPRQTLPHLIFSHLAERHDIIVKNYAIPGTTTKDLLSKQLSQISDQILTFSPVDLITLEIGTNDILTEVSQGQFKKNYTLILDKLAQNPKAKIVVINIPALSSSKIMLYPYNFLYDLRVRQFNSIINNLVEQKKDNNFIYVDLYSQTKDKFETDPSYFSEDYFHPSAKGYKLWSEIIYASLNQ